MNGDAFLDELAEELYEKRGEARVVPYSPRRTATFEPRAHECHSNVDRWVADHVGCAAVRGWLVFNHELSPYPVVRFQAHSVLEEDGRLVDITPSGARKDYPFLRHPDGPEMFDLMVSKRGIISLTRKASVRSGN